MAPVGVDASPQARALAAVSTAWQRVMAMPASRRNWLVASVALLGAVAAAMFWYAEQPDWRTLFSGMDGKDVQQVSQELAAAGITYQMTADNAGIQVPAEQLDKARMAVATKGMPQTGRLGFELFDKPNWTGSEFDEHVNYQRALEGELEHTIEALEQVRSARVHLVLPEESLFLADKKVAKASVVLTLKHGSLDQEQADSIRSLVAGAVENLSQNNVTLVDADGRLNFKPRTQELAHAELEQLMEAKLIAMLEPLAGRDNVRATVNVSYDESTQERTDEVYDPGQTAALSMDRKEQTSAQAGRASGIPGTASNSPAAAMPGAAQGSQAAAAPSTPPLLQRESLPVYPQQGGGAGQTFHEESGTYGVTKHLLHTEQGPGQIRRITAAVLVNDRGALDGAGKQEHTVWKPRSRDEMRRLEELAQAAVGFDEKRGDQVVVENVSFSTNAAEAKPQAMERVLEETKSLLHSQPGLLRTLAMGMCGILLVIFGLRPILRQATEVLREPVLLPAGVPSGVGATALADVENGPVMMERPPLEEADALALSFAKSKEQLRQQAIFEQVAEHIRREPTQSTRLLEAWIGAEERG
jgi:flagellar M-ring protein FliF